MEIEKYLVLNKYLLSLFGVSEFKELQEKLKDVQVGEDSDSVSYFCNVLRSLDNLKIPENLLLQYDRNIQSYVKKINFKRDSVKLKYFQYLAVLFTEIFLDNLRNKKQEFLYNLNNFLDKYKNEYKLDINEFTEKDLQKLAFWMATGSGKTLIMHINYHQFLNYNLFTPENIILITPNDGLSKQHYEEMQKSGIPCRLYIDSVNSGIKFNNEVLIIEITKFVEYKKGGGVTLPVEVFEGKNLVFVDEGHKGKKSEEQKWAKLRNKLSKDGFCFEYSATFAQILSEKQSEILEEYSKSIIFDYSYKYFYLDGYGKDFSVLNVKEDKTKDFSLTIFVANLLSFYEQLLVYKNNYSLAKQYNIEKPLWIFVGTTVSGKGEESDVVLILDFIKKVISDKKWLKNEITKILNGKSGLKNETGQDAFENKFSYLRKVGVNVDDIYQHIFNGSGELNLYELKNAEGEFGLKTAENEYFGVVNIGNTNEFKKHLEKKDIYVKQDSISSSLFDSIKAENSTINILIGSKKFIEGWDTWRVSCMGLLNIGKGQGPQIIQLFGRGVRLKGQNMSLKRSGDKNIISLIETLNIYSIKADYLNKFLEAISKEEIDFEPIEVPVSKQHQNEWKNLVVISKDDRRKFEDEEMLKLEIDKDIYVDIDLTPKVSIYTSQTEREEVQIQQLEINFEENNIPQNVFALFRWDYILKEILQFKLSRGYWNLVFNTESLKNLLLSDRYKILSLKGDLSIKTHQDVEKLQEIAIMVIKKYIDRFYNKHRRIFETQTMEYKSLEQTSLFVFETSKGKNSYTIYIDKKNKSLIKDIEKLINDVNKLIEKEDKTLPRVYFDRHLFLPILLKDKRIEKITPEGLVESEEKFIVGLREYLKNNNTILKNSEIFLLKNFPKSGVGFYFSLWGFYPDFIMWIKKKSHQKIVFIDPKGLEHSKGLNDEKIKLKDDIKKLEQKLKQRLKQNNKNISLESFIVSKTKYQDLIKGISNPPSKEELFKKNHILFLEDKDSPKILIEKLINN
ncbi:MAG: DEAD/DEAH box helicase family protein [Endomicrobiia bacterium]